MPYVVTGNLGKRYEYGQALPEANEWPPHLLAIHMRRGSVRLVSDSEAAELGNALALKQKKAAVKQLERDMITAHAALAAARSKAKQLAIELAAAQAKLVDFEDAEKAVARKLVEARGCLPPEAPTAKPEPLAQLKAPEPAAPTDAELRKKILVEVAGLTRRDLLHYAQAEKPEHGRGGQLVGSGYGIDLSDYKKATIQEAQEAFITARLAQLKAKG